MRRFSATRYNHVQMTRFGSILFAGLALLSLPAVEAQQKKKPVTVADITSMRRMDMAGQPVWAPDGKTFVYRQGGALMLYTILTRDAREVAKMEPMNSAAAKVPAAVRFDWENRGVREESMQWFPEGNQLLISAGGDLFILRLETGKFDQLTATPVAERDPKLSPDGRMVAFRRDHDLWVLDISAKKEIRLTYDGTETLRNGEPDWVYPEELGLGTAYWWSPDSKMIAYLQFDISAEPLYPHVDLRNAKPVFEPERYPQAGDANAEVSLGVVPAAGGPTRWMDVGSTRRQYLIGRVKWMPDARHIAVQRLTRIQDRLDLLAADATTGETRLMLREADPYWVNLHDDLHFLDDGKRFVWSSERDGYRHLYLYSLSYSGEARELRRLTSGGWEVRRVAGVDSKTERVYYLSSEPSPMETQLYSIRLSGKDKTRLTSEAGSHDVSLSPGADYFVDSYSNRETPSRRVLRQANGAEYATLRESDRSVENEFELLPSEVVTLKAADGRTDLYGSIVKPVGFQPGRRYPAIVLVYGGPHAQSIVNRYGGLSMDQMLAHRGYVVWQLDNRGAFGRGHVFETPIHRELGVVELADQKAGVDYLTSLGYVDPQRIGIYGWSYGGFMTLNAMLNAAGTFRAGIAGAPVTRFANYDSIYTERYMSLPGMNPEGYKKTDLSLSAGNLKGSLMLIHNIQDDNVLFQNTLQMVDALEKAGKQFELMIYTQKAHWVMGPVRRQMWDSMVDFFDRNLKF